MRLISLKIIAILSLLILSSTVSRADVIAAKDTVTGTVIGKNKEPLPGAKVEIVGQPYSTFTDLDGRFRIKCDPGAKKVNVSYPKARDVKKKISPDMTVQIGRTWRQVPERYQWFVGAGVGIGRVSFDRPKGIIDSSDKIGPYFNIMGGYVKAIGAYGKAGLGVSGDYIMSNYAIGAMFRLGCPLHFYIGPAITHMTPKQNAFYSKEYLDYVGFKRTALGLDEGLMFRVKNIGINLSTTIGINRDYIYTSACYVSAAYFFNK